MVCMTVLRNIYFCYRVQTGVQDTFLTFEVYSDEITMQLIDKACKMLGMYCWNIHNVWALWIFFAGLEENTSDAAVEISWNFTASYSEPKSCCWYLQ